MPGLTKTGHVCKLGYNNTASITKNTKQEGRRKFLANSFHEEGFHLQKLTILLLLPLLFAGCGTVPDDNTPQTETGFPVVIEDAFGKEVKIENPPERIVSIAPSQTEILFALDLGEKIVGVTNWCNHPEEAKTKTRVGDMHLDFETIVSLKPDLVVGIRSMQEDNLLRLENLDSRF